MYPVLRDHDKFVVEGNNRHGTSAAHVSELDTKTELLETDLGKVGTGPLL